MEQPCDFPAASSILLVATVLAAISPAASLFAWSNLSTSLNHYWKQYSDTATSLDLSDQLLASECAKHGVAASICKHNGDSDHNLNRPDIAATYKHYSAACEH